MKQPNIFGRIFRTVLFVVCFFLLAMLFEKSGRTGSIEAANSDISIWKQQRDEIYSIEATGFEGVVVSLSPGLHRHDVDTVTVKLKSWTGPDSLFSGKNYLQKRKDTVSLFILYSESIWPPNQIESGDTIRKEQFGFDYSVYKSNGHFKKKLSLLFCSRVIPDSIGKNGNFIFGTYGSYFNKQDTLFSGYLINGEREGSWRYYQPLESPYKIFEGRYSNNKRNGVFKKYYQLTNQLTYEENYKDNLPHGQFKWWFFNGQIESIKYFDNGKPVGTWEFYDSKGALIKKLEYGKM